jgi:hypothetical protein
MSEIGYGYGSEWHLCRWLAYHRHDLNRRIEAEIDGRVVDWLDFRFEPKRKFFDAELKGMDFLPDCHPAREHWRVFWPQTGNVTNWDAVGRIEVGGTSEWLLVEAKANLAEIQSWCRAKEAGGLPVIRCALNATKRALGVPDSCDWLRPYYQYANRLASLHFLLSEGVPAHLLLVYFLGDRKPSAQCPKTAGEWHDALSRMRKWLGIHGASATEGRVHTLFLPVLVEQESHGVNAMCRSSAPRTSMA